MTLGEMHETSTGGFSEGDHIRSEPQRGVFGGEEVTWVSRVSTIDRRLNRELCATSPAGSEDRAGTCHDGIGVEKLTAEFGRQVREAVDVHTVAHGRGTGLAVFRGEEATD